MSPLKLPAPWCARPFSAASRSGWPTGSAPPCWRGRRLAFLGLRRPDLGLRPGGGRGGRRGSWRCCSAWRAGVAGAAAGWLATSSRLAARWRRSRPAPPSPPSRGTATRNNRFLAAGVVALAVLVAAVAGALLGPAAGAAARQAAGAARAIGARAGAGRQPGRAAGAGAACRPRGRGRRLHAGLAHARAPAQGPARRARACGPPCLSAMLPFLLAWASRRLGRIALVDRRRSWPCCSSACPPAILLKVRWVQDFQFMAWNQVLRASRAWSPAPARSPGGCAGDGFPRAWDRLVVLGLASRRAARGPPGLGIRARAQGGLGARQLDGRAARAGPTPLRLRPRRLRALLRRRRLRRRRSRAQSRRARLARRRHRPGLRRQGRDRRGPALAAVSVRCPDAVPADLKILLRHHRHPARRSRRRLRLPPADHAEPRSPGRPRAPSSSTAGRTRRRRATRCRPSPPAAGRRPSSGTNPSGGRASPPASA